MRRLLFAGALAAALSVTTGSANAQLFNNPNRTYSVDSTAGSGRYFSGFGLGLFPMNYRGGYNTDPSLMAPPSRSTNTAPFFGMGLGWFGKRSPSPRPEPNYSYNPQVGQSSEEPPLFDAPAPMAKPEPTITIPMVKPDPVAPAPMPKPEKVATPTTSITLEVRLPSEKAEVFVDNAPTKQTGLVRSFSSPPLSSKDNYKYEIRAQWSANGKKHNVSQTVSGKPGEKLVADFTK